MSADIGHQAQRLSAGGQIDRTAPRRFSFNGREMHGYAGDTLASALLANGVSLVGRSFKYHRPRGIFTAGPEEPNALVTLGTGADADPNTRATVTELTDGMIANPQNYVGSLSLDLMAVNNLLSPFLGAGFYYKTFMWPKAFWEKLYEPVIRRAAGLGALSGEPDPAVYDKGYLHCDVLVIGSGPAGLMAALSAAESGASVILAEQDFAFGGSLLSALTQIAGQPAQAWAAQCIEKLRTYGNVRLLNRTHVMGTFDHGIYGALEQTAPENRSPGAPAQTLWRIYTKQSVLAAGASDRPVAFGNNDKPGVMLAGAVETYLNRFAVAPGNRIVGFGSDTARLESLRAAAESAGKGIRILKPDEHVTEARGFGRVRSLKLSTGETVPCDTLAVTGGRTPNVHLTAHHRNRPVWDDTLHAFVPGKELPQGQIPAGACTGAFGLSAALKAGLEAAKTACSALDGGAAGATALPAHNAPDYEPQTPVYQVKGSRRRAWVDLQNDVTTKDIKIAHQEGFRSVEHLKRYTTLGMATDQGKTSNVTGLALMAELSGKTIAETGTTMFRPPAQPVSMGAFTGRSTGKAFRPTRLTPTHAWAEEQGAVFIEVGNWLRAQWYPLPGETDWLQSVNREVLATRNGVGLCDVSTLGKIDIQGKDAAAFLNLVYANAFAKLPVGKVRYGIMLREDGMVMDDGTTARLGEHHYVMTTTTANAVSVFRHLEFCRQCLWPDMDVQLISATDQWAQIAIAGPNARRLLERVTDAEHDVSDAAFPFMGCGDITVCGGTRARLFRISFSGELAYELAVPSRFGDTLIRRLMAAGKDLGVTPYGLEALNTMRIEKGHPTGNELNGQTTALDLGLEGMASKKKDYIGRVLRQREVLARKDGLRLAGFRPVDPAQTLTAGAHFLASGAAAIAANDEGYMTSVAYSPTLKTSIGLGLIDRGKERIGETVRAVDFVRGQDVLVEIVSPHFVDPEGERLRG